MKATYMDNGNIVVNMASPLEQATSLAKSLLEAKDLTKEEREVIVMVVHANLGEYSSSAFARDLSKIFTQPDPKKTRGWPKGKKRGPKKGVNDLPIPRHRHGKAKNDPSGRLEKA